jgi:adenosylmethionine-8-amino-7-oxononanoate aminotransferase
VVCQRRLRAGERRAGRDGTAAHAALRNRYFGFASEPAIRLAAKLVEITPPSLTRAYLTLGGSEAVDAAVRFIVQYWNARGRPRRSTSSRSSAATTGRRRPARA